MQSNNSSNIINQSASRDVDKSHFNAGLNPNTSGHAEDHHTEPETSPRASGEPCSVGFTGQGASLYFYPHEDPKPQHEEPKSLHEQPKPQFNKPNFDGELNPGSFSHSGGSANYQQDKGFGNADISSVAGNPLHSGLVGFGTQIHTTADKAFGQTDSTHTGTASQTGSAAAFAHHTGPHPDSAFNASQMHTTDKGLGHTDSSHTHKDHHTSGVPTAINPLHTGLVGFGKPSTHTSDKGFDHSDASHTSHTSSHTSSHTGSSSHTGESRNIGHSTVTPVANNPLHTGLVGFGKPTKSHTSDKGLDHTDSSHTSGHSTVTPVANNPLHTGLVGFGKPTKAHTHTTDKGFDHTDSSHASKPSHSDSHSAERGLSHTDSKQTSSHTGSHTGSSSHTGESHSTGITPVANNPLHTGLVGFPKKKAKELGLIGQPSHEKDTHGSESQSREIHLDAPHEKEASHDKALPASHEKEASHPKESHKGASHPKESHKEASASHERSIPEASHEKPISASHEKAASHPKENKEASHPKESHKEPSASHERSIPEASHPKESHKEAALPKESHKESHKEAAPPKESHKEPSASHERDIHPRDTHKEPSVSHGSAQPKELHKGSSSSGLHKDKPLNEKSYDSHRDKPLNEKEEIHLTDKDIHRMASNLEKKEQGAAKKELHEAKQLEYKEERKQAVSVAKSSDASIMEKTKAAGSILLTGVKELKEASMKKVHEIKADRAADKTYHP